MPCQNPQIITPAGVWAPCGKCTDCKRMDQWYWAQRMRVETALSPKTWFLTLTYKGEREIGYKEVQNYLKKVRKLRNEKLRFCCVAERGTRNGRLHFHLLAHGRFNKRDFTEQWDHGFTHCKMIPKDSPVETKSDPARYMSKYMTKGKGEKGKTYRASIRYGFDWVPSVQEHELVKETLKVFPFARVSKVAGVKVPRRGTVRNAPETKDRILVAKRKEAARRAEIHDLQKRGP